MSRSLQSRSIRDYLARNKPSGLILGDRFLEDQDLVSDYGSKGESSRFAQYEYNIIPFYKIKKTSSIFVDPQDTVSQMKAKIQKLTDFCAVGNNLCLVLEGRELQDEDAVSLYKLDANSKVYLGIIMCEDFLIG